MIALALALCLLPVPPAKPTPEPPPAVDPLAAELCRFPARPVAEAYSNLALAHWEWARDTRWWVDRVWCLNTDRWPAGFVEQCQGYVDEASHRHSCWMWLSLAHFPETDLEQRRGFLRELREAIGDEEFDAGRMPPPLPCWGEW